MSDAIRIDKRGHVVVLTMDNPPANTWTAYSLSALADIVAGLDADRDVWSLVLTGAGDRFFSAGADLTLFADSDPGVAREMARLFGRAFETLSAFRGLSIAAINGYAMGGGLEVALACDLRVAAPQAQLALPEARVGLLPCAGGTQNLSWLVGEGWAKRMILCGERLSAEKALEIGLVEEVASGEPVLERALALARQSEEQSPGAVAACKQLIQSARSRPLDQGYILERELFVDLFATEDQKEGVNAFLEKRQARWKNR